MLSRVLAEIERHEGGVDLRTLARALGIEESALSGMVAHLVRKGKLVEVRASAAGASGKPCGDVCAARAACPLVAAVGGTSQGRQRRT